MGGKPRALRDAEGRSPSRLPFPVPRAFSPSQGQAQSKTESEGLGLDPVWAVAQAPGAASFISASTVAIQKSPLGHEGFIVPKQTHTHKPRGGVEKGP